MFFYNCHINLRELKCNKNCSLFCVNDLNNFVFAAFLYPFSHWLISYLYSIIRTVPAGNFISYTITVMHKFSVEFDNASIITGLIFSNKSAAFFSFIVQSFLCVLYQVGSILCQIDMVEPKE